MLLPELIFLCKLIGTFCKLFNKELFTVKKLFSEYICIYLLEDVYPYKNIDYGLFIRYLNRSLVLGWRMVNKSKNNKNFNLARNSYLGVISILLILTAIFIIVRNNGYLVSEPTLEFKPENKYTETIRVLSDFDYKPYSYKNENGEKTGRSVEIISEIANRMHVNLDLHFIDWQRSLKEINDGAADLVLTCESNSRANERYNLLPSIPTFRDHFVFFSKRKIHNMAELYDKKIAVVVDANSKDMILFTGLYGNCVEFPTTTEAIEATMKDNCDCFICRYSIAVEMLKKLGIKELKPTVSLGISYVCVCGRKDNTQLMNRVNEAIKSMIKDGTLDRINNKWVEEFITYNNMRKSIWHILPYMLLIIAVMILYFMYYNHNCNKRIGELRTTLANVIANSETLIIIDLIDNSYVGYTESEAYSKQILQDKHSGKDFFKDTDALLDAVIHPDDVKELRRKLDEKLIKDNLKNGDFSFSIEYRLKLNNIWTWCRLCAYVNSNDNKPILTIAVYNISEEKTQKLIFDDMASYFESVYVIDLFNNIVSVVKAFSAATDGSVKASYSTTMTNFAVNVDQKYYASIVKLSDPEYMANILMEKEKEEYIFRLTKEGMDPWHKFIIKVLQRDVDNKPIQVLLSGVTIEKEYAAKLEENYKNKTE